MIQRLIHRLKHFWDRKYLIEKILDGNYIYYRVFIDKQGNIRCPCCLRHLDITWRIGWGPFDRVVRMEGCYVIPVVYIDASGNPTPLKEKNECVVYCLECPGMMELLGNKKW